MNTRQQGRTVGDAEILEAARAIGALGGANGAPRVLAALCAPGVDAAGVARVVGQEPGLTARVLRVANSAFYGLSREVSTLDRAIVVLGLDAVRGIAAAACLDRGLLRAPPGSAVDLGDLLRHSVAAAAAADALARPRHRPLAGEAFIGALLHDFGVVVQVQLDAAAVAALATESGATTGIHRMARERHHVGASHADCGGVVFDAWQLPATLVGAVRHHHEPASAPADIRAVTSLVHLGDLLALRAGFGFAAEAEATESEAAEAILGIGSGDLDAVAEALPGRVAELQRALAGP